MFGPRNKSHVRIVDSTTMESRPNYDSTYYMYFVTHYTGHSPTEQHVQQSHWNYARVRARNMKLENEYSSRGQRQSIRKKEQLTLNPGSVQSAPRTANGRGKTVLAQISAGILPTNEFPSSCNNFNAFS
jgi:hypothetical protein